MENHSSPNAIPRRTSSIGVRSSPVKSVLRPMPEDTWLKHTVAEQEVPLTIDTETRESIPTPAGHGRTRFGGSDFGTELIDQETRHWPNDKEKLLMGPYDYMESHPGKDIRAQLIAAFNTWLSVPRDSLNIITKVVGMLHTSSLL